MTSGSGGACRMKLSNPVMISGAGPGGCHGHVVTGQVMLRVPKAMSVSRCNVGGAEDSGE